MNSSFHIPVTTDSEMREKNSYTMTAGFRLIPMPRRLESASYSFVMLLPGDAGSSSTDEEYSKRYAMSCLRPAT